MPDKGLEPMTNQEGVPMGNAPEYSVSELSGALKKCVEGAFGHVRVRGEFGRVVRAASGHVYADLKDDKAVINCNIWKPVMARLSFMPEEGMEVIASGKLSTYAPQSKYNLIIDSLEIAGEGALMALFEKRKKALAAEGLFDSARKRPIPFLPNRIGVVTSRQGAVIRDILHRLADRFPREVMLWPVPVQGKEAAGAIARAIAGFNALGPSDPHRPDLIIVARGGGSLEDLWAFNEEEVVRAAAASNIPLISAIGHETDITLIDYAADKRAPTPSAAAEMAVPVLADERARLLDLDARRARIIASWIARRKERLGDLARGLPQPGTLLAIPMQRLDLAGSKLVFALKEAASRADGRLRRIEVLFGPERLTRDLALKAERLGHIHGRLEPGLSRFLEQRRREIAGPARLLEALSYRRVLDRGFAVIRDEGGAILDSAERTASATSIVIEQKGGRNPARILK